MTTDLIGNFNIIVRKNGYVSMQFSTLEEQKEYVVIAKEIDYPVLFPAGEPDFDNAYEIKIVDTGQTGWKLAEATLVTEDSVFADKIPELDALAAIDETGVINMDLQQAALLRDARIEEINEDQELIESMNALRKADNDSISAIPGNALQRGAETFLGGYEKPVASSPKEDTDPTLAPQDIDVDASAGRTKSLDAYRKSAHSTSDDSATDVDDDFPM